MRRWSPLTARHIWGRPEAGQLVAIRHGVWEVERAASLERGLWSEEDEAAWLVAGMPDPWTDGPYRVELIHRGGVNPNPGHEVGAITLHIPPPSTGAGLLHSRIRAEWSVYPAGRWPQCSCCGEPMPCQAQRADEEVAAELQVMEKNSRKLPGCCWACGEAITHRQEAVVYAGMNLDMPGGPEVRFHTRRSCWSSAVRYEDRWRANDPTRPRIVTWPKCPGTLFTHQDRSQECFGGLDECHGAETHDHGHLSACYVQSHGCGRGCGREGHPGAVGARRRARQIRVQS